MTGLTFLSKLSRKVCLNCVQIQFSLQKQFTGRHSGFFFCHSSIPSYLHNFFKQSKNRKVRVVCSFLLYGPVVPSYRVEWKCLRQEMAKCCPFRRFSQATFSHWKRMGAKNRTRIFFVSAHHVLPLRMILLRMLSAPPPSQECVGSVGSQRSKSKKKAGKSIFYIPNCICQEKGGFSGAEHFVLNLWKTLRHIVFQIKQVPVLYIFTLFMKSTRYCSFLILPFGSTEWINNVLRKTSNLIK